VHTQKVFHELKYSSFVYGFWWNVVDYARPQECDIYEHNKCESGDDLATGLSNKLP
jgi:hypothetical protein